MENLTERVRRAVAAIEQRDSALAEELNAVRDRVRRSDEGRSEAVDRSLETMVEPGGVSTLAQETIVLRTGRPVLAITNNEVRFDTQDAESQIWRDRLRVAREVIGRAVLAAGRIDLANNPRFDWVGTGWLVAEDVVVTNRHVASEFARGDGASFVFRSSSFGTMSASIDFLHEVDSQETNAFDIESVLHVEPEDDGPDMAFLRVRPRDGRKLAAPIALSQSAPAPAEQVAVIGYPARDSRIPEVDLMDHIFGNVYNRKRLAPGQLIGVNPVEVEHDCSTLGGNSGSVVLSLKSGEAVGLHFSGQFLRANYAVPAALVADRLKSIQGGGARRPATAARPAADDQTRSSRPASEQSGAPQTPPPAEVTFQLPLTITVRIGSPEVSPVEPATVTPLAPTTTAPPRLAGDAGELFTEGRPEDYADRKGYLADFLGDGFKVPLPVVNNKEDILTFDDNGLTEHVLRYQHFSVVMSASRRMCFYSAVNISGKKWQRAKRPGWRTDGRIPKEAQILKECYGDPPKFARGHMTRREDPIWGDEEEAAQGNSDSMHVTNVVPQMQPFNAGFWLGLESYALENARQDEMLISVFTGPFFAKNDPVMFGVKIPITFWKVIAFIHDETNKLCATGYTMSQRAFLQREEFVFGQFEFGKHETAQQPIAVIEQRAGLDFGRLSSLDPLRGNNEAPSGLLTDFSQIVFV